VPAVQQGKPLQVAGIAGAGKLASKELSLATDGYGQSSAGTSAARPLGGALPMQAECLIIVTISAESLACVVCQDIRVYSILTCSCPRGCFLQCFLPRDTGLDMTDR
jgi:hypothetical protein